MTLGDIKTNSGFSCEYDENGDVIDGSEEVWGWDPELDTLSTYTAAGEFDASYCYLPQWVIDNDEELTGKTSGWYLTTDMGTYNNCKNGNKIPFGTGYLIRAISADPANDEPRDVQLVFSGEVKATPADTPVGPFTLAGNASPRNLTLGNIKTNSGFSCEYDENGDVIDGSEEVWGWDPELDTLSTYTAAGEFDASYCYLPQWVIDNDEELTGKTSGWYLTTDMGTYNNCKNSFQLPMGSGFLIRAISASPTSEDPREVTVIVPSALAD